MTDSRVTARILAAAEPAPADTVVEIGPGRGALTRRLVERVGQVVAVELDERLAMELPARLGMPPNLTVRREDARRLCLGRLFAEWGRYKVVANLPYYAAAPIVRRFLESETPPALLVVMVQREVGEAMTARPGAMSLLSVATQFYAEASVVTQAPARAFRPAPKVSSTVVKLRPYLTPGAATDTDTGAGAPPVAVADAVGFFDLARAGFSAPRKQLRNCLMQGAGAPAEAVAGVLCAAGIDGRRRPATLSLAEWGRLHAAWPDALPRLRKAG